LLEWADKVKGRYVSKDLAADMRKVAEPLLRWLREAEEEEEADSGNEDQEDDLEIKYDDRALPTPMKDQATAAAAAAKPKVHHDDDGADDVDIDAI